MNETLRRGLTAPANNADGQPNVEDPVLGQALAAAVLGDQADLLATLSDRLRDAGWKYWEIVGCMTRANASLDARDYEAVISLAGD